MYQKAYMRGLSYNAWLQGQYTQVAFGIVMANAFAKKGAQKAEYPEWVDPIEKFKKPKVTSENIEEEFRKQQVMQNDWLFRK